MPKSKYSNKSIISRLFNRRDISLPEEDVTVEIAGTLEEITRQVKNEASGQHLLDEEFFAPTHVLKPGPAEAAEVEVVSPKAKIARRCRLTPDQYENIIENCLSALDIAGQIIDTNRAITSKLKKHRSE